MPISHMVGSVFLCIWIFVLLQQSEDRRKIKQQKFLGKQAGKERKFKPPGKGEKKGKKKKKRRQVEICSIVLKDRDIVTWTVSKLKCIEGKEEIKCELVSRAYQDGLESKMLRFLLMLWTSLWMTKFSLFMNKWNKAMCLLKAGLTNRSFPRKRFYLIARSTEQIIQAASLYYYYCSEF